MVSKCQLRVLATSRGQMHAQEVAIQWTFDVERNSFFFLSLALVGWTQCSASLPVFCTQLLQMHTLIPEVKPRPMKPSICSVCICQCGYMIYNTRTFLIAEFAVQQYLIPRLSLLHTASDESWNLKMCFTKAHLLHPG